MAVSRYERGATMHGTRRLRKRVKIKARAVARQVERARTQGIPEHRMPGWVKIVVAHARARQEPGDYIYFEGHLYVFRPGMDELITVYPIEEDDPDLDLRPEWKGKGSRRARANRFH